MYSQSEEEKYIVEFFNDKEGKLLDLGAYHPEIFSNSRQLIFDGWKAVLVEASPKCYKNIFNYYKDNKNVETYNIALNNYDGKMVFYDSEGAVATGVEEHYDSWKTLQKDFEKTEIDCLSWETFYSKIGRGTFEFINIDIEGMDWLILQQINLDETKTELVCIEHSYNLHEMVRYLSKFGFDKVVYLNAENIILGKDINKTVILDVQNGIIK